MSRKTCRKLKKEAMKKYHQKKREELLRKINEARKMGIKE